MKLEQEGIYRMYQDCPVCHGEGYIIVRHKKEEDVQGYTRVVCSRCNGKGIIDDGNPFKMMYHGH